MWGGATFDVAYNFLKENPWERLERLRKAIPNVLLRASNAVGYKNYPDNVIKKFVHESAKSWCRCFPYIRVIPNVITSFERSRL